MIIIIINSFILKIFYFQEPLYYSAGEIKKRIYLSLSVLGGFYFLDEGSFRGVFIILYNEVFRGSDPMNIKDQGFPSVSINGYFVTGRSGLDLYGKPPF